jgi:hypothetical protein
MNEGTLFPGDSNSQPNTGQSRQSGRPEDRTIRSYTGGTRECLHFSFPGYTCLGYKNDNGVGCSEDAGFKVGTSWLSINIMISYQRDMELGRYYPRGNSHPSHRVDIVLP